MSATMSGLETLRLWLDKTSIYQCNHRPVPLSEYTLDVHHRLLSLEPAKSHLQEAKPVTGARDGASPIGRKAARQDYNLSEISGIPGQTSRERGRAAPQGREPLLAGDPDFLATITLPYVRKKKAVLVFCPTKAGCETTAKFLAKALPLQFPEYAAGKNPEFTDLAQEFKEIVASVLHSRHRGQGGNREAVYDKQLQQDRLKLIQELQACPSGLCPVLKQVVKYGVAYHHSGLTNDEKHIVERGFRQGTLFVLVATSTLSTGINLPAKAVILRTPYIAMNLMDAAKYKQMSGRAGRTGFDSRGDSILLCKDLEQLHYCREVLLPPFQAKLTSALAGSRLVRSLLEIVASQAVNSVAQIGTFLETTLLFALTHSDKCSTCMATFEANQLMFRRGAPPASEDGDGVRAESDGGGAALFSEFMASFDASVFVRAHLPREACDRPSAGQKRRDGPASSLQVDFTAHGVNYGCRNCILEFAKQVIAYLREKHFLVVQAGHDGILPTPLGKAAFASSISPEESARIFDDLEKARRAESLVLETDLHLLYLTTPHFKGLREPNWDAFI